MSVQVVEVELDLKRKEDLIMRKKLRACSSSPIRKRASPKFLEAEQFVPFSQRKQSFSSLRKPEGMYEEDSKHVSTKESFEQAKHIERARENPNANKTTPNEEHAKAHTMPNDKEMKKLLLWQVRSMQEGSPKYLIDSQRKPANVLKNVKHATDHYHTENNLNNSPTHKDIENNTELCHSSMLSTEIEDNNNYLMKNVKKTEKDVSEIAEDEFPPPPELEDLPPPPAEDIPSRSAGRDFFSPPPPPPPTLSSITPPRPGQDHNTQIYRRSEAVRSPPPSIPPPPPPPYISMPPPPTLSFSIPPPPCSIPPPPSSSIPPPPPPPPPTVAPTSSLALPSSSSCLALANKIKTKFRSKSEDRRPKNDDFRKELAAKVKLRASVLDLADGKNDDKIDDLMKKNKDVFQDLKQKLNQKEIELRETVAAKDDDIKKLLLEKEQTHNKEVTELRSKLEFNSELLQKTKEVLQDMKQKLDNKDNEVKERIAAKDEDVQKLLKEKDNEHRINIAELTSKLEFNSELLYNAKEISQDLGERLDSKEKELQEKLVSKDEDHNKLLVEKEKCYNVNMTELTSKLELNSDLLTKTKEVLTDMKSKLDNKENECNGKFAFKYESQEKMFIQKETNYEMRLKDLTEKLDSKKNEILTMSSELQSKETKGEMLSFQEKTIHELKDQLVEAKANVLSQENKFVLMDDKYALLEKDMGCLVNELVDKLKVGEKEAVLREEKLDLLEQKKEQLDTKVKKTEQEVKLKDAKLAFLEQKTRDMDSLVKTTENFKLQEDFLAQNILARLKPQAVTDLVLELFGGVQKSEQSNIVITFVNKLDTDELLEVMSTLLATVDGFTNNISYNFHLQEQLAEVIMKAMEVESRRKLILQFLDGDDEFSDFSEFLAFSEMNQPYLNNIEDHERTDENGFNLKEIKLTPKVHGAIGPNGTNGTNKITEVKRNEVKPFIQAAFVNDEIKGQYQTKNVIDEGEAKYHGKKDITRTCVAQSSSTKQYLNSFAAGDKHDENKTLFRKKMSLFESKAKLSPAKQAENKPRTVKRSKSSRWLQQMENDTTDSESDSLVSSQNSQILVLRKSKSQDVLNWLARIKVNSETVDYKDEVEMKVATLESRLCQPKESLEIEEVDYSYTFEVDRPGRIIPVYKEEVIPEASLTITSTKASIWPEFEENVNEVESNENNSSMFGDSLIQLQKEDGKIGIDNVDKETSSGKAEIQYPEIFLEDQEINELEYYEIENNIKNFKGSIGFAVLKLKH